MIVAGEGYNLGMSTTTPLTDIGSSLAPIMLSPSPIVEPTPRRWTREEYHRLDELGLFEGQKVELIDGEIVQLSPQKYPHAFSVDEVQDLLIELFGKEYWVRSQLPLGHGESSEPEPDASVVKGDKRDFSDHPTDAVLVVEVSMSTLQYDKTIKASQYAKYGVPDYWVIDLVNRQLIVHRQPIADEAAPMGHRYESIETIAHDGEVSPLEVPEAKLSVAAMLPPVSEPEKE